MAEKYDVIVVGVGAMGSCACWQLARRGVKVLGIDRFAIPNAMGSSHGETRMIRMAYYEHPDYVPLLQRAYELWHTLQRQSKEKLLHEIGGIYAGPKNGEVIPGAVKSAKQFKLDHELLSHADLEERFEWLNVPSNYTAVYEPHAGFLLAERCIAAAATLATQAGATFVHEEVLSWSATRSAVTVRTDAGEYTADHVIFCSGPWTSKLLADLDVRLIVTRQLMGWIWPRRPDGFHLGEMPVWGVENAGGNPGGPEGSLSYGFPILPNSAGMKVALHAKGKRTDPDTIDRIISADDEASILRALGNYIPNAVGPVTLVRTCMYTNSPDSHFIIDRHPEHKNVSLAAGFSGHGFKFATVIGEILADFGTNGRTERPIRFLSLGRFRK